MRLADWLMEKVLMRGMKKVEMNQQLTDATYSYMAARQLLDQVFEHLL